MGVAALLTACGTGKNASSLYSLNGEWNIVKVEGKSVKASDEGEKPFLGINIQDKTVYGFTGCNRLTGALGIDEKTKALDFGATGSTRMMCADMTNEQMVLEGLGKVKGFKAGKEGTLNLTDADGKTVMELKKKTASATN